MPNHRIESDPETQSQGAACSGGEFSKSIDERVYRTLGGLPESEPEAKPQAAVFADLSTALSALAQGVRPEVFRMAIEMEQQLRTHDHDRGQNGWKDSSIGYLMRCLHQEIEELTDAMIQHRHPLEVYAEAADVANFAMMVGDRYEILWRALHEQGAEQVVGVDQVEELTAESWQELVTRLRNQARR